MKEILITAGALIALAALLGCYAALILSAHTDMPLVRRTVSSLGYRIDTEQIAWAAGRFYVVLRAVPCVEAAAAIAVCDAMLPVA